MDQTKIPSRNGQLLKGSDEARRRMAELRSLRKKKTPKQIKLVSQPSVKLVKGSEEAKKRMAELRNMRKK